MTERVSKMCDELYMNRVFVTDPQSHRHRTWCVRVVHRAVDHDVLVERSKYIQPFERTLRYLMMSTNTIENHYVAGEIEGEMYMVSYFALWFTDGVRKHSLTRILIEMCGGVDRNIRLFRTHIKKMNARRHGSDTRDASLANDQLNARLDAGQAIKTHLSFCLMPSNDFWDVVEAQVAQNVTDASYCDVVSGDKRKIKHPKRSNKSLNATVEVCKRLKLAKGHRPKDRLRRVDEKLAAMNEASTTQVKEQLASDTKDKDKKRKHWLKAMNRLESLDCVVCERDGVEVEAMILSKRFNIDKMMNEFSLRFPSDEHIETLPIDSTRFIQPMRSASCYQLGPDDTDWENSDDENDTI